MIKKQKKIIIIAAIAVVLLTLIFIGLKATVLWGIAADSDDTLVKIEGLSIFERVGKVLTGSDGTMSASDVKGNHGESMVNKRPLIFDQVERQDIKDLVVMNESGGYHLYRGSDGELYFEGAEALYYDSEMMSSLIVNTGYLLAMQEVENYNSDLSVYGLDEESLTGWFELTTTDDDYYKVLIGDKIITSGGYYVMLEGRDAVYILDTDLEKAVLKDLHSFLVAQVAVSIPQTSYNAIDDFSLIKSGERFMEIDTDLQYASDGTTVEKYNYQMTYPGDYVPSSTNYGTVLSCFINFTGDNVVEYGISKLITDPDGDNPEFTALLKKYGFFDENNKLMYRLSYSYENRITQLYISAKTENDTYYVCSPTFDLIAEFPAATLSWLDWDLIKWVDAALFQQSINDIQSYEVTSSNGVSALFELSGDSDNLKVTVGDKTIDTVTFRQFYKQFLYCSNMGYGDNSSGTDVSFEIKITMKDSTVYDFKFYDIATLKSYYTINGEGEFYISRDNIKTLSDMLTRILNGETFEASMVGK